VLPTPDHSDNSAELAHLETMRRKEAELALHRREQEFADFVENAAEGLHRVAGDGTILWANRAELQMLGYAWHEYVGRHIAEFHVDADVIGHILTTLTAGGTLLDQPARLRCKDGSIKHVVIHSNGYFEDGQLRYTRCFTRDATERRQRDEALAQRDRVLRAAPVAAALLVGPDFTFRLANRRYCALMDRDGLEGQAFGAAFPELQGGEATRLLEQGSRAALEVDELRVELARADGSLEERFLQLSLEPLSSDPEAAGEEQGVILVAVDVTAEVRSRRSLERAHAEREQLLAELTTANRTKDEFLAMLGHELRNPLSPIVTALQLMRMRGETGAVREREIIQRQVEHLVRLVDDLLDVARATRGQIELKFEQVDIAQPLAKAAEMAGVLLERRRHRLEVEVEPGLLWQGDPMRLAQVVSNLLTNAARYTEPGGRVALRARREAAGAHAGWLRISVQDNGIGLAPEMLLQVFGLFFQAKRSVERSQGGLGIGLALVKNIVELHGGKVEARSDGPGRGSEFVVLLPAVSVATWATPAAPQPAAVAAQPAARKRIMVVDDNADAAETLGLLLGAHGHEVEVFNDPVSALAAVARLRPDIAVLDIGLPVLDGYQLAARMRTLLAGHPCRLFALTGYGQDADLAKSAAAGFERHLVKPIMPDQVAQLVSLP
jgi:PAS domain S-box-containing protein